MSTTCSAPPAHKGVTAVEKSANKKLEGCSCTLASQHTCPRGCPFFGNGCYAEQGPLGFTTRRMNRAGVKSRARLARLEAEAIGNLSGTRPLRLHVVGDSTTRTGTKILAKAAEKYMAKHGEKVWTYTHAWRDVPRADWGPVSVLASCETQADVAAAHDRGYPAALVVPEFEGDKAYDIGDGFKAIPCPSQTRGKTCAECRLCLDGERLRENKLCIAFAAHGARQKAVRVALEVLK